MGVELVVRGAEPADARGMARVVVDCWRETYRGLMSDATLDHPDLLTRREQFWNAALTDPRYSANTACVASHRGSLIGVAMSGPPLDGADERRQLYLLYVYAAFHGSGAGSLLLDAVIDPTAAAQLWVADPNPRAQAFYRKHGFVQDGAVRIEEGVRSIRMIREADPAKPF
ncbi:GNAT family N-acetyltransferase [Microbacterium sp. SS28]|uniref:GNAT family N-acetyltransferase n=1 Tax=Microbacterium sp. SS28 TaxID=2919948 RepID=UPI001FA9F849|nr:GNAT family N-acetyltransferase [Microbacterium sp. SS28]